MSKSAGNVVLVRDVTARGMDPLALRLAFLQHRYRQQMNLTWQSIDAANALLLRWRSRVANWARSPSAPAHAETMGAVHASFADDLDSPAAVLALRELERDETVPPGAKFEAFAAADRLLGLDLARDVGKPSRELPPEVQRLLDERQAARARGEWGESDRLRSALADLGVNVQDTPEGQRIL
jgi:cysteinyl-tRNA synthetase